MSDRLTNVRRLLAQVDTYLQKGNVALVTSLLDKDNKVSQARDNISTARLTIQDVLGEVSELERLNVELGQQSELA